jgi:hypothetical protein
MSAHTGRVDQVGADSEGRAIWQARCTCSWEAPTTHSRDTNAARVLRRHLQEARAARPRKLHLTNPVLNVFELRYDPASPAPDFVVHTIGEVYHLQEFGHEAAVGCCPNVDRNGRHLLPQHRRSAS